MALDKVVDSAALDADLLAVADAIRAKGGTAEVLTFPDGFVSAVEGIPTGGGTEEIILPDTYGRVYMTLAPSDVEETFTIRMATSGTGSGGAGNSIINIGSVENGVFTSESEVALVKANISGVGSITIPAHDKPKVLEFKNAEENDGYVIDSYVFFNFNSPVILDMKINSPISIKPGGTSESHITRTVRKWTLNADITSTSVQTYNGFQFAGCDEIDLSRVTWPSLTTVNAMFLNSACRRIIIPNFLPTGSTANSLLQFFDGCANLKEIVGLATWDLSSVKNIKWAFRWCQNLLELDLSSWGQYSSGFTNIDGFNRYCYNLKTLNLSGWNVSHLTSVYDVFDGCTALENIVMDGTTWIASNFNLSTCTNLTSASLNAVIAALPEAAKTITLGSTNKAKLTEDEIAVATGKGWTVA